MTTRDAHSWVALEAVTAANLNTMSGGFLGTATAGSTQSAVSGTNVDVTSATVTVNVGAGRTVEISGQATITAHPSGTLVWSGNIVDNGTVVGSWGHANGMSSSTNLQFAGSVLVLNPSAGSHIYKLQVSTSGGNIDIDNAQIIVKDIGSYQ